MKTAFLLQGDCVERMRSFPDNCIDAVVTDPPYGLSKEPDMIEVLQHWLAGDDYVHTGGGFMGKTWDSFVPGPSVWREVLRVLKPGGHVLSFFGTRTYDLGVLAMRIAGFEIRDQLAWMYGSGFPKSLDVAKELDKREGHWRGRAGALVSENGSMSAGNYERTDKGEPITELAQQWAGWGTALKPAQEPIVLARKPLIGTVAANVLAHGTGAINVDACRIGTEVRYNAPAGNKPGTHALNMGVHGMPQDAEGSEVAGRWPANVILDEAAAAMLDEQSGERAVNRPATYKNKTSDGLFGVGGHEEGYVRGGYGDTGGASRFFYVAKASTAEREAGLDHLPSHRPTEVTGRKEGSKGQNNPRAGMVGSRERKNIHPTVKPIALMRYLVRLITPPGGIVLDPFAGSGTTLCAAVMEGHRCVGIELTPEYVPIIEGRLAHAATAALAG